MVAPCYHFPARISIGQGKTVVFDDGSAPWRVVHKSMGHPRCGCVDAKGVRLRFKRWKEGERRERCRRGECLSLLPIADGAPVPSDVE
jgi:hypothetical protein